MNSEERWNLFRVIWPEYIRLKHRADAAYEAQMLRMIIRSLAHV